ncbi:hypothetical protein BRC71_01595 [Halobacteriales archaeon QH_7_65_31]|nr:MAG: hypothetical protein BRC71_01595 [Halobacteriales archaeon QH_7_65_31]
MNRAVTVTYAVHGLAVVFMLALAVGNYRSTGDPLSALAPLVLAALVTGLGVTMGRIIERRE